MQEKLQIIGVILGSLNLTLIVTGILITVRHYRFNRTWSYIERYNSADFKTPRLEYKKLISELNSFDENEKKAEFLKRLIKSNKAEDIERVLEITTYINLFTELGTAARARTIDKKAIEAISGLVVRSWDELSELIKLMREKAYPNEVYTAFQELYDYILKKELHKTKKHRSRKIFGITVKKATNNRYE